MPGKDFWRNCHRQYSPVEDSNYARWFCETNLDDNLFPASTIRTSVCWGDGRYRTLQLEKVGILNMVPNLWSSMVPTRFSKCFSMDFSDSEQKVPGSGSEKKLISSFLSLPLFLGFKSYQTHLLPEPEASIDQKLGYNSNKLTKRQTEKMDPKCRCIYVIYISYWKIGGMFV